MCVGVLIHLTFLLSLFRERKSEQRVRPCILFFTLLKFFFSNRECFFCFPNQRNVWSVGHPEVGHSGNEKITPTKEEQLRQTKCDSTARIQEEKMGKENNNSSSSSSLGKEGWSKWWDYWKMCNTSIERAVCLVSPPRWARSLCPLLSPGLVDRWILPTPGPPACPLYSFLHRLTHKQQHSNSNGTEWE